MCHAIDVQRMSPRSANRPVKKIGKLAGHDHLNKLASLIGGPKPTIGAARGTVV